MNPYGAEEPPGLARPCVEALKLASTLIRQDPHGVRELLRHLSPSDAAGMRALAHDLQLALKHLPPEVQVRP